MQTLQEPGLVCEHDKHPGSQIPSTDWPLTVAMVLPMVVRRVRQTLADEQVAQKRGQD
jgi:hypothetical protein